MLSDFSIIKREDLETDLRELGKEILRELFLSSRRLALYTREHPAEGGVAKRPFNWLKKLFRLRSYFDFHLYQGNLYSTGIQQKDEVFIRGLKSELSRFSLGSVYIYSQTTPEELVIFLRRMAEKLLPLPRNLDLQRFLDEKKISSIRIKKSEINDPFIEESISLVGKCDDFEAGTLARVSLSEDPQVLLDILLKKIRKEIDLEGRVKLDFRLKVFQSILLDEFSKLSGDRVKGLLEKEFENKNWEEVSRNAEYLEGVKSLVKAFIHHPEPDFLFGALKEIFVRQGAPDGFFEKALDESARLKIRTLKDSESLLDRLVTGELQSADEANLKGLWIKLLNLNQTERLKKTIRALFENLSSEQENIRTTSLAWLKTLVIVTLENSKELFHHLIQELLLDVDQANSLVLALLEHCAEQAMIFRDYASFNQVLQGLKADLEENYSEEKQNRYRGVAGKFSEEKILRQLIGEIKAKRKETWEKAGDSLVLLGGEKVPRSLEELLIDPDRGIRQMVLKIAGKLGEEGASHFSKILLEDSNFQRDPSGNLTLDSWFKIRNTLHILSDLKSEQALEGLRKRLYDPDHKVKKGVLQTLEKIGTKRSQELLLTLARDEDKEIKKLALMALVSCRSEDSIEKLREQFYNDRENAIPILHAISNIGGEKAFRFLLEVINRDKIFDRSILGKSKDEEIKLEALKALKKRKDSESVEQVEKLRERYGQIKVLFDKSSQLNESLKKVLEKIYK